MKKIKTPLTEQEIDILVSFSDGESNIRRERGGISLSVLSELALEVNVEKCPGCRWWCESGELIPTDSDDPDGKCSNCRMVIDV